jgi:fibronectin-binding autotransporter adhesin
MPTNLAKSMFLPPQKEPTYVSRTLARLAVVAIIWPLLHQTAFSATKEWANVSTDWATNGNWVGGVAPVNDTSTDIASFGSQGAGAVNPNLATNRSIAGVSFLSGAYAYTFSGAVLTIGASGISNSSTNTQTFSNTLRVNNTGETWSTVAGGSLVLNGTVDLNANASTSRTLNVAGAGNTTFNGVIQNSFAGSTGNLAYSGTGILTLAGTNTYSGTTTLSNGGTTLINGDQSSATGAVSVNNTGTLLGGTGTIGGAVTLNTASRITGATNGTVGTLTLASNLTVLGTSGYIVDISGTTSDRLNIGGTLDLSGSTSDALIFSGTFDGTSSYTLATYASVSGTFNTVTGLDPGYQLIYGTNSLIAAPIPEPSTWIGGALALAAVGFVQRGKLRRLIARVG